MPGFPPTQQEKVKMAKALFISALCVLALAAFAHAHESVFHVEGRVYCDTCRVQFETRISQSLPGATVRLQCRNRNCGKITYTIEALAGENGQYNLPVVGDHEADICEVTVVKSPRHDCNSPMDEHARVVCTKNNGLHTKNRYANPIGYMINESLSECKHVLDQMGFFPIHE